MITIDDVKEGLNQGLIQIVDKPASLFGLRCKIGDYEFFFAGDEFDDATVEEYFNAVPFEERAKEILDALKGIHHDVNPDEYQYYESYLKENLAPKMKADYPDLVGQIIDIFEDYLSNGDTEPIAHIKGKTYDKLADAIKKVMVHNVPSIGKVSAKDLLTPQEKEEIYREQKHQYLKEDAICQAFEHDIEINDDDAEILIERFMREQDCNVPENTTWDNLLCEYQTEKAR